MAEKRVIRSEVKDQGDEAGGEGPGPIAGPAWSEWWKGTYAMYWFIIGALALDVFMALQVNASLDWPYSLYLSVLLLIVLIFLQYRLFVYLWGQNGRWAY